MKKIINVGGKDYTMKSSAFTQFAYKDMTGRSLLADIQSLQDLDTTDMTVIDNLTEVLLKLSYVMLDEADNTQAKSYEDFIKSIDNLYDEPKWIEEVISLAMTPLSSGNLQKSKLEN